MSMWQRAQIQELLRKKLNEVQREHNKIFKDYCKNKISEWKPPDTSEQATYRLLRLFCKKVGVRSFHCSSFSTRKRLRWFAFWGLLAAILIQCALDTGDLKNIVGELIVFMSLAGYILIGCLKEGIWDRRLKPEI